MIPLILVILIIFNSCHSIELKNNNEHTPFISTIATTTSQDSNSGWVDVYFINVGQGDAILLVTHDNVLALIDTGNLGQGKSTIAPLLTSIGFQHIDWIFISHFHLDHYGGLFDLFQGQDGVIGTHDDIQLVNKIIAHNNPIRDLVSDTGYQYYLQFNEIFETQRMSLEASDKIDLSDSCKITILATAQTLISGKTFDCHDENANSLVLHIECLGIKMITLGDLPGDNGKRNQNCNIEDSLVDSIGEIDILKVSHHGSNSSTSDFFLENISPSLAIISSGEENSYGHPHQLLLERLARKQITTLVTNGHPARAFNEYIRIINHTIHIRIYDMSIEIYP